MNRSLIRSYLYVPGSNPQMVEKALETRADALVLDLEDAVAPQRKRDARAYIADLLKSSHAKPMFVRINGISSGLADLDIEAVAGPNLAGLRLPKTESPADIHYVAGLLDLAGCKAGVHCLIESARGVEQAFAIATSHPCVRSLGLGEADLSADLGVSDDAGLTYARSRLVVAARAARLPAPVQSVYRSVRDLEGLRLSTEAGKRQGFFGRSIIHPSHITVVNTVFTPTEAEVADARNLLARLDSAVATGTGAFVLDDGRFVDLAVVESARQTLALAQLI